MRLRDDVDYDTPIIDSGHVGYIVGDAGHGNQRAVFACLEHAPDHTRTSNRMVYRDEVIVGKSVCSVCGCLLATVPAAEAVV